MMTLSYGITAAFGSEYYIANIYNIFTEQEKGFKMVDIYRTTKRLNS